MAVQIIVVLCLLAFSIVLISGKGSGIINFINFLSEEAKTHGDKKKLGRLFGFMSLAITIIVALILFVIPENSTMRYICVLFVVIIAIATTAYANIKYGKPKK